MTIENNENTAPVPATTENTTTTALVPSLKNEVTSEAENVLKDAKEGKINAFYAIAVALKSMREALEDKSGEPPRWIRIARVGGGPGVSFSERPVGRVAQEVTGAFLAALGIVAELTLKAKDLLADIDGVKALVEVGAEMLETLSDDQVVKSIAYSVGAREPKDDEGPNPKKFSNPLAPVGEAVTKAKNVMKYIPGPEDIAGVARELYYLMNIAFVIPGEDTETTNTPPASAPVSEPAPAPHVDVAKTGKARLISWTIAKPIPAYKPGSMFSLSAYSPAINLGKKNILDLTVNDTSTASLTVPYTAGDAGEQTLEVYKEVTNTDIKTEVTTRLTELGYNRVSATDVKSMLIAFQEENKLPAQTGELDLDTIHRLMNMDYKNETLLRAKAYPTATDGTNQAEDNAVQ